MSFDQRRRSENSQRPSVRNSFRPSWIALILILALLPQPARQLKTFQVFQAGSETMDASYQRALSNRYLFAGMMPMPYGVYVKEVHPNGLCLVELKFETFGGLPTPSSSFEIDNVLCDSGTTSGIVVQSQGKIGFFVKGSTGKANFKLVEFDGSSNLAFSSHEYTGDDLGVYNTVTYAHAFQGETDFYIVVFTTEQNAKLLTYPSSGIITVTDITMVSDDSRTVEGTFYVYGTECTSVSGTNDFCLFWGQSTLDLEGNTYTILVRKLSDLGFHTWADIRGIDFLPLSCVLPDEGLNFYCTMQDNSGSNFLYKFDYGSFTDQAPSGAGSDSPLYTAAQFTNFRTANVEVPLSAAGRLYSIASGVSQIVLVLETEPMDAIYLCDMSQATSFCDPADNAKSLRIKLHSSTTAFNPSLPISVIPFIAGISLVTYQDVPNRSVILALGNYCDHATEYYSYLSSEQILECKAKATSPDATGNHVTTVTGYRANDETYSYEACLVDGCEVCNDDRNTCQVCSAGKTPAVDGSGNSFCVSCPNPHCGECSADGSNVCLTCKNKYTGTTGQAEDSGPFLACQTCATGWSYLASNTDDPTNCDKIECSENCVENACTTSNTCDTCADHWMHGPDSQQCTECDSNADGYGYRLDTDSGTCVPNCSSPRVTNCITPGGDATEATGSNSCPPEYSSTDDNCNRCAAGFVWKSGNSAEEGPADDKDVCVTECNPTVVFGCSSCDATNHCSSCMTGYIMSDSSSSSAACDLCDEENGYAYLNGKCQLIGSSVIRNCKTLSSCGSTCLECMPGYTGSTCNSCAVNYSSSGCGANLVCTFSCALAVDPFGLTGNRCSAYDDSCRCTECTANYDPADNCRTCLDGYTVGSDGCEPACGPQCVTCSEPNVCSSCSDDLLTGPTCETCVDGTEYYKDTCQLPCSFTNLNHCTDGYRGCTETANVCTTCATGYTGDQCHECADGYDAGGTTPDPATAITCTKKCDDTAPSDADTCIACGDLPYSQCTSCNTNYEPRTGDGEYGCKPTCAPNCSACSVPNQCDSDGCNDGYIFSSNACIKSCVNCGGCSADPDVCDASCDEGWDTDTDGKCTVCASGWNDDNNGGCEKSCANCEGTCPGDPDVCSGTCSTGWKADLQNRCLTCDTDYHEDEFGDCVPDCMNCSGSCATPNVCDGDCTTGWDKNGGTMCDTCANGYTAEGTNACIWNCPDHCDSTVCVTSGQCLANECSTGYTNSGVPGPCNQCATNYHDIGSGTINCIPDCPTHCSTTCTTPNQCPIGMCALGWAPDVTCDTCDTGYHDDGAGNCLPNCPDHCEAAICPTQGECPAGECSTGFGPDGTCAGCIDGYHSDGDACVPDCHEGCNGVCLTPNACPTGQCKYGFGPDGECSACIAGQYHDPTGLGTTCVPDCNMDFCDPGCDAPNTCSDCNGRIAGALCNTCEPHYENWPDCTPVCVSHCKNDQCSQPYICDECEEGYAGKSCASCDSGYKRSIDGTCVLCMIPGCAYCSEANVCAACFESVLTQDKSRCLPKRDVCKPNIKGCKVCSSNSKCSKCAADLYLMTDGTCQGDDEFCSVDNCNSCKEMDVCEFCQEGYQLSDDGTECVFDCTIKNCAACNEDDTCSECDIGYYRNADDTACLAEDEVLPEPQDQQYVRDEGNAVVEFSNPAANLPYKKFKYTFVNEIDGTTFECPEDECTADLVQGNEKALTFSFRTTASMSKGHAVVSYVLNDIKLPKTNTKRVLQTTSTTSTTSSASTTNQKFVINNVVLKGDGKADRSARDAFITINAIRFFGTVILGVCNTAHAFWSTNLFSWMQLWALLKGPFLSYPDRFLTWHYKWYLLAINFGDPFKGWDDWSKGGITCKASQEYPLSRLGCSITDTFGQNLIVIVCILSFCFVMSLILYWSGNIFKSDNAKRWITRLQSGLALSYFIRFMMAIMPSLVYFSILQFYTHKESPHMSFGVIAALFFLGWYSLITLLTYFLSKKIWTALTKYNPKDLSLEYVAKRHGGLLSGLSFQFIDLHNVTAFWQLQYPVIEFFRVFLVSVFMIVLGEDAGTSLGFILVVEVLRFAFQCALFRKKTRLFYAIADVYQGTWFLLYILLKLGSTDGSMAENNRQEKLGLAMAVFICFEWAAVLIDICHDAFFGILGIVRKNKEEEEQVQRYEDGFNDLKHGNRPATQMQINEHPVSPASK